MMPILFPRYRNFSYNIVAEVEYIPKWKEWGAITVFMGVHNVSELKV